MYIRELEKNKKYRVEITNGLTADGKRNKMTKIIYARNRKDAEKQGLELEKIFKGELSDTNITLTEFTQKWWQSKIDIGERAREMYRDLLRKSILPNLGDYKLKEIKTLHIDNYLIYLTTSEARIDGKDTGYSNKTRLHHLNLLNSIFDQAVKWDYIEVNPCTNAIKPKVKQHEKNILELDEVREMLLAVQNESLKHQALVNLAVYTGARRSEIVGLTWNDIDLYNGVLVFRRGVHANTQNGTFITEGTKNGTEKRVVTIPQRLVNVLINYRESEDFKDTDFLFYSASNKAIPCRPDSTSQWFSRFIKRYDLTKVSLQDIRHTSVSLLIANGVDPNTVAARHGHGVDVSLRVYTHLTKEQEKSTANLLDNLF